MESDESIFGEAHNAREAQRNDAEARSIIHDVSRLYTLEDHMKIRWVWELLQNAKDVALEGGVSVSYTLSEDQIEVKHNGAPFTTENLLAVLYKTSTKSLGGEDGTGKYGTGFVTTHILSKNLTISGIHRNEEGDRPFNLLIDRRPAFLPEAEALNGMKTVLNKGFQEIEKIIRQDVQHTDDRWTRFRYPIQGTRNYAENGLRSLERNLTFTLLINDKIKEVSITTDVTRAYQVRTKTSSIQEVSFARVSEESGMLYYQSGVLTFAIPAIEEGDSFRLLPIEDQAILYKEFPLIGTEGINLPVYIQHEHFLPTEQRNAIRAKSVGGEETDPMAKQNRQCFEEFVESYLPFLEKLFEAEVSNLHLLAKSGLPQGMNQYFDDAWYKEYIQVPIRNLILTRKVVKTISGSMITIAEARFIDSSMDNADGFYELAKVLLPEQLPGEQSIWSWSAIMAQQEEAWPQNLLLSVEDLLSLIPETIHLKDNHGFDWLKKLYAYLEVNGLSQLGEEYPIYPNELCQFKLRQELCIHPFIDDQFKEVSSGLGRKLDEEFLNKKLGELRQIQSFDLPQYYQLLNTEIGSLKVSSATEIQVKSILRICCLFKTDRSRRRNEWYGLLSQLLPDDTIDKTLVSMDYDYNWKSAERWSIKYLCQLIEKIDKPSVFANTYFQSSELEAFDWFNRFLSYVFAVDDDAREVILKFRIIPNQIDQFIVYRDYVFAEDFPEYFTDSIKDILRDYTSKGDPRRFLIDRRIQFEGIRKKEVYTITKPIDELFARSMVNEKVKKGGEWNDMCLALIDWCEEHNGDRWLPVFAGKKDSLNILALGEGFSKKVIALKKTGKSFDDIEELAKIKLSTSTMHELADAAIAVGEEKLMEKAQEMLKAKKQIERWKAIGAVAERSFSEAMTETEPSFEILNPDIGKDFVIEALGKNYAIEIKSVDPNKPNVNMSYVQGKAAVTEKDHYALCVINRPEGEPMDMAYFKANACFVTDIGYQIGDAIEVWEAGWRGLDTRKDVKVVLEGKDESIYVSRNIWRNGVDFDSFVNKLKAFFQK